VDRLTGYFLFLVPFVFAFLFAFDDFVGRALHTIDYNNLVFLGAQYLSVSSTLPDINLSIFKCSKSPFCFRSGYGDCDFSSD